MRVVDVAIAIVTYRSADLTIDCLSSLEAERVTPGVHIRAIVVDNASGDDEAIAKAIGKHGWWSWVTLVTAPKNGGFAYGNNLAIKYAMSDGPPQYVHLLNPDTVVRKGAIGELVRFLEAHPDVGIAGSSYETLDGSPWPTAFRFPSLLSEFESGLQFGLATYILRRWVVPQTMTPVTQPIDWIPGASMMIRWSVFDRIGGFDETYFLYFEETDFCFRAKRAGIPTWYVPASRVMHIGGQSTNVSSHKRVPERLPAYVFESRRRYFVANHGVAYAMIADVVALLAHALGSLKRTVLGRRDVPYFLTDLLRNSVLWSRNRRAASGMRAARLGDQMPEGFVWTGDNDMSSPRHPAAIANSSQARGPSHGDEYLKRNSKINSHWRQVRINKGTVVLARFFSRITGAQGGSGIALRQRKTTTSVESIAARHRRIGTALAHGLRQSPVRRSTSLVELRPGGSRNLFLVHDGDGETLLYLNLAHRMPSDLSVVGIEPLRIPGVPLAHPSIEQMAAFYIGEIRRIQPNGPYLLGGLCAGGVIAFEIACQLEHAGESVQVVFLLEAAAPHAAKRPHLISSQRLGRLTRALTDASGTGRSYVARVWAVFHVITRKFVNTLTWEIAQRGTRWSIGARFRLLRYLRTRGLPWPRFLPELNVRQIYEAAEAFYVPRPLAHASVVLARARGGVGNDMPYREIYADETFGWRPLTDKLVVIDVDGGHSSMLQQPLVQSLATAVAPIVAAQH
jgi:N-acetylglucosaminyl-diphospho-decaprenol L-rhamnosyltransferase